MSTNFESPIYFFFFLFFFLPECLVMLGVLSLWTAGTRWAIIKDKSSLLMITAKQSQLINAIEMVLHMNYQRLQSSEYIYS